LARCVHIPVAVRINALFADTPAEVDQALACGARILMLPMSRTVEDVREFLGIVDHRARTIIQIETPQLAEDVHALTDLDWDYAYIGLNDLMVARGGHSIWEALLDGTAQRICQALWGRRYGFGGCTFLGGGQPIINVLILHELVRLGGSVALMRRTFKRELTDRNLMAEMEGLRQFFIASEQRGPAARQYDYAHLRRILKEIIGIHPGTATAGSHS